MQESQKQLREALHKQLLENQNQQPSQNSPLQQIQSTTLAQPQQVLPQTSLSQQPQQPQAPTPTTQPQGQIQQQQLSAPNTPQKGQQQQQQPTQTQLGQKNIQTGIGEQPVKIEPKQEIKLEPGSAKAEPMDTTENQNGATSDIESTIKAEVKEEIKEEIKSEIKSEPIDEPRMNDSSADMKQEEPETGGKGGKVMAASSDTSMSFDKTERQKTEPDAPKTNGKGTSETSSNSEDVKPPTPAIPSPAPSSTQSTGPRKKKIFDPEELRTALMPTLEKLYRQDPESIPFRQPVDPVLLQIPVSPYKKEWHNYFD